MGSHDSGMPAGGAEEGSVLSSGLVTKQAGCCCCFADDLRVITASRPFPVVGFGSHAFCMWSHLRGPGDVGAGVPPRPSFGIESILLCFLLLTDLPQLQV